MVIYFEIGAILVALFLVFLILKFISEPLVIIINSVIGIVLFFVMNLLFKVGIPISILSVGVAAIGGIFGVILVFLLHVTGLGF